jgi:hypothetical protein
MIARVLVDDDVAAAVKLLNRAFWQNISMSHRDKR